MVGWGFFFDGRRDNCDIIKSHTPWWATHRLDNNYITEVSSVPHVRPPNSGVWVDEEPRWGAPRSFGLMTSRAWVQELQSTQGKEVQARHHAHWEPRQSSNFTEASARLTCWSLRVSWVDRKWLWNWDHKIWWQILLEFSSTWNFAGGRHLAWVISTKFWPSQQPVVSSDGIPQANQPKGVQHSLCPSTDRLPKDFLSPQSLLDMLLDTVLPKRGPSPSFTCQGVCTGPYHKEAYINLYLIFTLQREHTWNKKTIILQLGELSPQKQFRTYPRTNWSLVLGWWEGSMLLKYTENPLQRSTSPKSRNITSLYTHEHKQTEI